MTSAEQIKDRLDIVDFIHGYVPLHRAGTNWKARCPFHNEKTPSFMVSKERQSWHCFGCFPAGQFVKTPLGYHRIETIDTAHYVTSGSGAIRKVLATQSRQYSGKLVHVRTRKLGGIVSLTADHHVLAVRPKAPYLQLNKNFYRRYGRDMERFEQGDREGYYNKIDRYYPLREISAGELTNGDFLLYPIATNIHDIKHIDLHSYCTYTSVMGPKPKKIPWIIRVDESFLKLIGYWIAEGSSHRAYIRFSVGNHEREFAEEIVTLINELFGIEASMHVRKSVEKTGIEITACQSQLANIFENLCGKGAQNKHIPFLFQELPISKQIVLLNAIMKGDGYESVPHRSKKTHRKLTTISRVLAEQAVDILLRTDHFPSLIIEAPKRDRRRVVHGETFRVVWSEQATSQHDSIYYRPDGSKYWLLPIRELKKTTYRGPVYNLTIEHDHSYVATNFAVSNCGKGGDAFTFLQEYEGMDFPEALRFLAQKTGVELEREDKQKTGERTKLLDVQRLAATVYHKVLLDHPMAAAAREYLKRRGLKPETLEKFQLGFSPESWEGVSNFLKQKGFTDADIFHAGLTVRRERGTGYYDRFRGRIMFPVTDHLGRIIGFGARAMGDEQPKYLNSPQTQLYNKSGVLYGLSFAKAAVKTAKRAVIVEGYMDAIASHEAGVENVVAASGTALTRDQLTLLARFAESIVLSFDTDIAGEAASMRGVELAWEAGFDVSVAFIPSSKDPDELIRNDLPAWKAAVAKPVPFLTYAFERVAKRHDLTTAAGKKQTAKTLLALLGKVPDVVEQSHYLQELARLVRVPEDLLRERLPRPQRPIAPTARPTTAASVPKVLTREDRIAERLLAYALVQEEHLQYLIDHLDPLDIPDAELLELYKALLAYYTKERHLLFHDFVRALDGEAPALRQRADRLAMLATSDLVPTGEKERRQEVLDGVAFLQKAHLQRELRAARAVLSAAESNGERGAIDAALEHVHLLTRRIADLSS